MLLLPRLHAKLLAAHNQPMVAPPAALVVQQALVVALQAEAVQVVVQQAAQLVVHRAGTLMVQSAVQLGLVPLLAHRVEIQNRWMTQQLALVLTQKMLELLQLALPCRWHRHRRHLVVVRWASLSLCSRGSAPLEIWHTSTFQPNLEGARPSETGCRHL